MPWDNEVDSGGGLLKNFEGTIVDAFFADGKYGTQLEIQVLLDHPEDHPRIADGIVKQWFGTGNGWIPEGNGATAKAVEWTAKNGNVQEPPKKFNSQSPLGQLVKHMATVDPDGKTALADDTKTAANWKALGHTRWEAVWVPKRVQNDVTQEWETIEQGKQVAMPVELLDVDASSNGQGTFDLASLECDEATLHALVMAAAKADTWSKFVPQAFAIPGFAGSKAAALIGSGETGPGAWQALAGETF